ncbi:ABC transporter ATP-binding protein [Neorhodopirellula lusitana]|uniref:ABC transporter ATP-binding protein n=1 Tax=Neorhodopirellula lusitana TaxID=445327 RepID=UPI003850A87F
MQDPNHPHSPAESMPDEPATTASSPSENADESLSDRTASNDSPADTNDEETLPQPANAKPLIEVIDLEVTFSEAPILSGINRTIQRGQTVAIIGESGCGKTVFMKTLVALLQPTRGQVKFDGQDLNQLPPKELAQIRRRFGFVFQHAALFDSMNIFDNVAFPIRQNEANTTESEVSDRVQQHLHEVGLTDDIASKFPAEISGGMQKRVGLARALVLKPELIVYDEPTTGLDPIMSDVINELILHTRRLYPVTSVVVTHDMHTARKVADRVMMFYPRRMLQADESQILFDGPPSQLEHADDRRVRQFVRGEAGDRLRELNMASA